MSRLSRAVRKTRLYASYRRVYNWLFPPRLPQMLIIGAHKGGTSALFHYLSQHPRLIPSCQKEISFFGSDLFYGRGLTWYGCHWDRWAPADAVRFEASPQYLFEAYKAAARIRADLPEVRMIAVLRDPVDRAYSAWKMYRRQLADDPQFYERLCTTRYTPLEVARSVPRTDEEMEDFCLAVEREAECLARRQRMQCSVLELGLYGPQLAHYRELFPAEQLLVLESDQLRNDRVKMLDRVLDFLDLPEWDWDGADLGDVFVGKQGAPIPPRAVRFLRDFYAESNQMLAGVLDPLPDWARLPPSEAAVA